MKRYLIILLLCPLASLLNYAEEPMMMMIEKIILKTVNLKSIGKVPFLLEVPDSSPLMEDIAYLEEKKPSGMDENLAHLSTKTPEKDIEVAEAISSEENNAPYFHDFDAQASSQKEEKLIEDANKIASEELIQEEILAIQKRVTEALETPGALLFNPPAGWGVADPKILPPRVKVMVIGKGFSQYPPSINLGMEMYSGTVKDYLKMVKSVNDSQGAEWKDLGKIRTLAGDASLSQVDMLSEWGTVRLMHVILKKGENIYVLTAAALKEEFPQFYREFFQSMRSLYFNKSVSEMVGSPKRKQDLQKICDHLKTSWQMLCLQISKTSSCPSKEFFEQVFEGEVFQKGHWEPFKTQIAHDFADMNTSWHTQLLTQLEEELLSDPLAEKKNKNSQSSNNQYTRNSTAKKPRSH